MPTQLTPCAQPEEKGETRFPPQPYQNFPHAPLQFCLDVAPLSYCAPPSGIFSQHCEEDQEKASEEAVAREIGGWLRDEPIDTGACTGMDRNTAHSAPVMEKALVLSSTNNCTNGIGPINPAGTLNAMFATHNSQSFASRDAQQAGDASAIQRKRRMSLSNHVESAGIPKKNILPYHGVFGIGYAHLHIHRLFVRTSVDFCADWAHPIVFNLPITLHRLVFSGVSPKSTHKRHRENVFQYNIGFHGAGFCFQPSEGSKGSPVTPMVTNHLTNSMDTKNVRNPNNGVPVTDCFWETGKCSYMNTLDGSCMFCAGTSATREISRIHPLKMASPPFYVASRPQKIPCTSLENRFYHWNSTSTTFYHERVCSSGSGSLMSIVPNPLTAPVPTPVTRNVPPVNVKEEEDIANKVQSTSPLPPAVGTSEAPSTSVALQCAANVRAIRKRRMARQRRVVGVNMSMNISLLEIPTKHFASSSLLSSPPNSSANTSTTAVGTSAFKSGSATTAPASQLHKFPGNHRGMAPDSDKAEDEQEHKQKNLKFLLQKELRNSDVGSLGRMVLPKFALFKCHFISKVAERKDQLRANLSQNACPMGFGLKLQLYPSGPKVYPSGGVFTVHFWKEAEAHLPALTAREGMIISMEDMYSSRKWNFKYRFWPNNKSRMYVMENTGEFVKAHGLRLGDFIMLYKDETNEKYIIRAKKVLNKLSSDNSLDKNGLYSSSTIIEDGSAQHSTNDKEAEISREKKVLNQLTSGNSIDKSGLYSSSTVVEDGSTLQSTSDKDTEVSSKSTYPSVNNLCIEDTNVSPAVDDIFSKDLPIDFASDIVSSPQLESIPSFGSDEMSLEDLLN
eukprot:Gb_03009 [translate_table: standard]